jgi:PTS system nitrogen regulatory IIA component
MDLEIKDVAELLSVTEGTIHRWLADGKIPGYLMNQQYRFSRIEIENWMMNGNLYPPSQEEKSGSCQKMGMQHFSLYRAVHKGEVLTEIPGTEKEEIIRETMNLIAPKLGLDADVISDLLLDREELMPTALSNGIAVPHTRDFLLKTPFDVIIVVFPKTPIEYGALDGKPVHTLFFLLSTNDKRHLHLLAKLAHLSSQEAALDLLRCKPNKEVLLDFIKDWEAQIASPNLC